MTISNATEQAILNLIFRGVAMTPPADVFISLHNGDPGETGANEIAGGSYQRQLASFSAASGGFIETDADVTFTGMPAVMITHGGVWDDDTAGVFLWGGLLVSPWSFQAGETFILPAGAIEVTLD